jgi:small subunit ribosomal protein S3
MGQKVHPKSIRIKIVSTWLVSWFGDRKKVCITGIKEDVIIRKHVETKLAAAGIGRVESERAGEKPGLVIGKKGADIEALAQQLSKLTKKEVVVSPFEIRKPDLEAKLVAEHVAHQLEKRASFRRLMKETAGRVMRAGATGIRIKIGGRVNGAEIARTEKHMEGRVPLHTLRADIDYNQATANTPSGTIGVKIWICRGERFNTKKDDAVAFTG